MRERTILFVDDEEKSRKYFRRIFREHFEIIVAGDGQEALEIFQARREEIGLVVTDQMMPGKTGLEFLRDVQRIAPEVVRILSTAYADSEQLAEAARNGLIEYFVQKPWEIEKVTSILREAARQGAPLRTGTHGA